MEAFEEAGVRAVVKRWRGGVSPERSVSEVDHPDVDVGRVGLGPVVIVTAAALVEVVTQRGRRRRSGVSRRRQ